MIMNISTLRSLRDENVQKFKEYGQQLETLQAEMHRCEGKDQAFAEVVSQFEVSDDARGEKEKKPKSMKGDNGSSE